jgi:hypothetical protein
LNGADSSYLNLFFEIFEYFAKASLRACMNLSYSWAADSNGLGNFLGGKYLGFLTSSAIVSSLPSRGLSPSAFFYSDRFLVESGTVPAMLLSCFFIFSLDGSVSIPFSPSLNLASCFSFSVLNFGLYFSF